MWLARILDGYDNEKRRCAGDRDTTDRGIRQPEIKVIGYQ
jgi:hypothetical protein